MPLVFITNFIISYFPKLGIKYVTWGIYAMQTATFEPKSSIKLVGINGQISIGKQFCNLNVRFLNFLNFFTFYFKISHCFLKKTKNLPPQGPPPCQISTRSVQRFGFFYREQIDTQTNIGLYILDVRNEILKFIFRYILYLEVF